MNSLLNTSVKTRTPGRSGTTTSNSSRPVTPPQHGKNNKKMDALRKTYHRAVQIPLENVERLWSHLETFENNFNSITAKKLLSDLSPAYTKARAFLRPLTNHLNALYTPSKNLILPSLPTFDAADRSLVGKWKAYLKWDESNPLEMEDKETLIRRIQGVYRKAVIRMRFHPEIWYMAYHWTSSAEKPDDALLVLQAGIDANPTRCVHPPPCASASHPE